jgi:serine/threonine protein kinase
MERLWQANVNDSIAFSETTPAFFPQTEPIAIRPTGAPLTQHLVCHLCGLQFPEGALRCPHDGAEPLLPDPGDSNVGVLLDGRYRLIERIGEGGVGAVYRAVHTAMRKTVAVKILHREYMNHPEFAGRFRREAKAASRLDNPNIVTVTDFGVSDGTAFLVMEHLEGQSLSKLLDSSQISIEKALYLLDQILAALSHAHQNGVIHRDLKSANVFLVPSPDGKEQVKLLDFGFAKITKTQLGTSSEVSLVTQPGIVFGTPAYISPEQATAGEVDHRTDIYAAGVLAFEMLTGQRPFRGDTAAMIIIQHLREEPPSMREIRPEISEAIEKIVKTALAKKKEGRFPTADSFRRVLAKLPGQSITKQPKILPPNSATLEEKRFEDAVFTKSEQPPSEPKIPVFKSGMGWGFAAVLLVVGAIVGIFALEILRPTTKAEIALTQKPTARAEALLAEGRVDAAEQELRSLSASEPYANILLGNLYFSRSWWSEGLDAYDKAIAQSPSSLQNQALLENVTQALRLKTRARAEKLLRSAKEAAYAPLVAATLGDNPEVRKAAAALLIEAKQESRVDQLDLALRDFADAESCEDRRQVILGLDALRDKRAAPMLLQRYQNRPKPDPDACLRQDLTVALQHLGVLNTSEPTSATSLKTPPVE